ncbi:MAG: methylmalonyl Co-A mutase-associated GTPase MeaB, partial [Brooklawnia sp.]
GLDTYRAAQQVSWMWAQAEAAVLDSLRGTRELRVLGQELEEKVGVGQLSALDASGVLLSEFAAQVPTLDWAQE